MRKREYTFYRQRHPFLVKLRRGFKYLFLLFVGYLLVHTFLVQTYRIDSIAMKPAYQPGDRVVASPLPVGVTVPFSDLRLPGLTELRRGDVVILIPPYAEEGSFFQKVGQRIVRLFSFFGIGNQKVEAEWIQPLVVKRVVGLPGDTIRIRNLEILVKPKDTEDFVSEFSLAFTPYTITKSPIPREAEDLYRMEPEEIRLKEDEYFVASDHRAVALDSRVWGAVRKDQIRSKVLFVYWPF
ncbi:MAG: signal peptidase I [Spirochaetales bacterium]